MQRGDIKTFTLENNKAYLFIEFGAYSGATNCIAIIYTGYGNKAITEISLKSCSLSVSGNTLTFIYDYYADDYCRFAIVQLY